LPAGRIAETVIEIAEDINGDRGFEAAPSSIATQNGSGAGAPAGITTNSPDPEKITLLKYWQSSG
jgi:hypothetical protein